MKRKGRSLVLFRSFSPSRPERLCTHKHTHTQRAEALSLYRDELERRVSRAGAPPPPAASNGKGKSKIPPDVLPPEALQVCMCVYADVVDDVLC